MVSVRIVTVLALLVAAPAAADVRRVEPNAGISGEAAFGGFGMGEGNISVSAIGGSLELALGHARWQFLITGFGGYGIVQRGRTSNDGIAARAATGARYIARSYSFGDGALELALEASVGLEMMWWRGGTSSQRADLVLGVDWQVRLWNGHQRTIRLAIDAVLAPADNPARMFACRGSCAPSAPNPTLSRGLLAAMGYAW